MTSPSRIRNQCDCVVVAEARAPRPTRPAAAIRRPGPARRDRLAPGDAAAPRHSRRPTAQLDPAGTRLVGEALRALVATGTSLLITEQKTDLLDEVCSRIVVIDGAGSSRTARRDGVRGPPPPGLGCRGSRLGAADPGARRRGMDARYPGVAACDPRPWTAWTPRHGPAWQPGDPGRRARARVCRRRPARWTGSTSRSPRRAARDVRQNGSGIDVVPPQRAAPAVRRPRPRQRPSMRSASGSPISRRRSGSRSRIRTGRSSPAKVRNEVAFGPRNLGRSAPPSTRNRCGPRRDRPGHRRRREPVRPGLLAPQALAPCVDPRDGHARRRPRRADDGSGARGIRGSAGRWRPRGCGPDRHRDQPRHALRGRGVRSSHRYAPGPARPRRPAVEVFGETAWPTLGSTFLEPPLAARVGAGSASGRRRPSSRCWWRWGGRESAAVPASPADVGHDAGDRVGTGRWARPGTPSSAQRPPRSPTTISRNDVSRTSTPAMISATTSGQRVAEQPARRRGQRGNREEDQPHAPDQGADVAWGPRRARARARIVVRGRPAQPVERRPSSEEIADRDGAEADQGGADVRRRGDDRREAVASQPSAVPAAIAPARRRRATPGARRPGRRHRSAGGSRSRPSALGAPRVALAGLPVDAHDRIGAPCRRTHRNRASWRSSGSARPRPDSISQAGLASRRRLTRAEKWLKIHVDAEPVRLDPAGVVLDAERGDEHATRSQPAPDRAEGAPRARRAGRASTRRTRRPRRGFAGRPVERREISMNEVRRGTFRTGSADLPPEMSTPVSRRPARAALHRQAGAAAQLQDVGAGRDAAVGQIERPHSCLRRPEPASAR